MTLVTIAVLADALLVLWFLSALTLTAIEAVKWLRELWGRLARYVSMKAEAAQPYRKEARL